VTLRNSSETTAESRISISRVSTDSSTLKIEETLQTPSEILMARDSMVGRSQLTMPRRGEKEDLGETVEEEETDSEEEEEEIGSVEEEEIDSEEEEGVEEEEEENGASIDCW